MSQAWELAYFPSTHFTLLETMQDYPYPQGFWGINLAVCPKK